MTAQPVSSSQSRRAGDRRSRSKTSLARLLHLCQVSAEKVLSLIRTATLCSIAELPICSFQRPFLCPVPLEFCALPPEKLNHQHERNLVRKESATRPYASPRSLQAESHYRLLHILPWRSVAHLLLLRRAAGSPLPDKEAHNNCQF